jgi:hypothetical protein
VRIKIADDNDNKPLFKMKEYKAQVDIMIVVVGWWWWWWWWWPAVVAAVVVIDRLIDFVDADADTSSMCQINSDAPLEANVVKVTAVDADGEAFNNINYSIYGKDRISPFQMFRVDSSTGVVRVAKNLR